jgi:DNA-binding response OmpR family regulator
MSHFIEGILKREGHEVHKVSHGAKALELLGVKQGKSSKTITPELIILDVMMPEIDGYAVAKMLHEDDRTQSIPILMLTGKGQPPDNVQMTPNIKVYLEKPFDPHNLCDMIAAIIGESPTGKPTRKSEKQTGS